MLKTEIIRPRNAALTSDKLNSSIPPAATSLFRSSSSDAALSISQRLGDNSISTYYT